MTDSYDPSLITQPDESEDAGVIPFVASIPPAHPRKPLLRRIHPLPLRSHPRMHPLR